MNNDPHEHYGALVWMLASAIAFGCVVTAFLVRFRTGAP
jgi:hypothetical protein